MTTDSRRDQATANYYAEHALSFIRETVELELGELYGRFTAHLPAGGRILDAGCGSGRDSLYFRRQGYELLAIDSCAAFVAHTQAHAGVEARCLSFAELDFNQAFDGVWASASLLHLRPQELPQTFERLLTALRPGGLLYASFKYGNFAGERQGRWFTDLDEAGLASLLQSLPGCRLPETWQTSDARPQRAHERWLNLLLRAA
ncbi:MAG: class I SAM-dependent methyltransferase [Candidatus Sericytochromatia bacterium]